MVSLQKLLQIIFIITCLGAVFTVSFVSAWQYGNSVEARVLQANDNLVIAIAKESDRFFQDAMEDLRQISAIHLDTESVPHSSIDPILESIVKHSNFFESIIVLDRAGRVRHVAPFSEVTLGMDMSNQIFYKKGFASLDAYFSPVFISPAPSIPLWWSLYPAGNI